MIKSRYYSAEEIQRIVTETESELDRRQAQAESDARVARIQQWIADPRNAETINNDPMVKQLRAMPQRTQAGVPATPRLAAQPAQSGKLPAVIDGNARFHPNHLRLKPATPQIESVKDAYVRRPNSI
jgi:hypothetical protein